MNKTDTRPIKREPLDSTPPGSPFSEKSGKEIEEGEVHHANVDPFAYKAPPLPKRTVPKAEDVKMTTPSVPKFRRRDIPILSRSEFNSHQGTHLNIQEPRQLTDRELAVRLNGREPGPNDRQFADYISKRLAEMYSIADAVAIEMLPKKGSSFYVDFNGKRIEADRLNSYRKYQLPSTDLYDDLGDYWSILRVRPGHEFSSEKKRRPQLQWMLNDQYPFSVVVSDLKKTFKITRSTAYWPDVFTEIKDNSSDLYRFHDFIPGIVLEIYAQNERLKLNQYKWKKEIATHKGGIDYRRTIQNLVLDKTIPDCMPRTRREYLEDITKEIRSLEAEKRVTPFLVAHQFLDLQSQRLQALKGALLGYQNPKGRKGKSNPYRSDNSMDDSSSSTTLSSSCQEDESPRRGKYGAYRQGRGRGGRGN